MLDTSALLALRDDEAGAEEVAALLREAASRVSALLAARQPAGPGDRDLLEQAAYALLHFPDREAATEPTPGFLARARVALLYYAERASRAGAEISPRKS